MTLPRRSLNCACHHITKIYSNPIMGCVIFRDSHCLLARFSPNLLAIYTPLSALSADFRWVNEVHLNCRVYRILLLLDGTVLHFRFSKQTTHATQDAVEVVVWQLLPTFHRNPTAYNKACLLSHEHNKIHPMLGLNKPGNYGWMLRRSCF